MYQLCPKCQGQGSVSKPPWVSGDVYQWTSTATAFICDVCHGAKVLLVEQVNSEPVNYIKYNQP